MWMFIAWVVVTAAAYLLAPKPKYDDPSPGTVETGAVAEEGHEIPVLFGTRNLEGMNVVWYGDPRIVPVKKSGGKK